MFLLGFVNLLETAAAITGTGFEASAPASNIATRVFSQSARSVDAAAASTIIDIDHGSPVATRVLVLTRHNLTSAATVRLRRGTSNGGSEVSDTGAIAAWRFTPWRYDGGIWDAQVLQAAATTAPYTRIEIVDEDNPDDFIEIGGAYLCDPWQPTYDPDLGLKNGHKPLSTVPLADDGADWPTRRSTPRTDAFNFSVLTLAEGDFLHQAEQFNSITEDVLYLPHAEDPARCQQYGYRGRMTQLDGLLYPQWRTRSKAFAMEQRR